MKEEEKCPRCGTEYPLGSEHGECDWGCGRLVSAEAEKRTYQAWKAMRDRVNRQSSPKYSRYGGRGISLCERWESFEAFLLDLGAAPPGMTLERIDNNSGYEPGNCRWATRKEQANNRTSNTVVEFNGERMTLAQWADKTGICRPTIYTRWQRGWPVERMLTERPNRG